MSDICLVRQPIFDRTESAIGYELRFRDPNDGSDPLTRSYLSGSFDIFRSGLPAYIRVTRQQLVERIASALDPRSLVVLLPSDLIPDEPVLQALTELKTSGVTIGLDEFKLPKGGGITNN